MPIYIAGGLVFGICRINDKIQVFLLNDARTAFHNHKQKQSKKKTASKRETLKFKMDVEFGSEQAFHDHEIVSIDKSIEDLIGKELQVEMFRHAINADHDEISICIDDDNQSKISEKALTQESFGMPIDAMPQEIMEIFDELELEIPEEERVAHEEFVENAHKDFMDTVSELRSVLTQESPKKSAEIFDGPASQSLSLVPEPMELEERKEDDEALSDEEIAPEMSQAQSQPELQELIDAMRPSPVDSKASTPPGFKTPEMKAPDTLEEKIEHEETKADEPDKRKKKKRSFLKADVETQLSDRMMKNNFRSCHKWTRERPIQWFQRGIPQRSLKDWMNRSHILPKGGTLAKLYSDKLNTIFSDTWNPKKRFLKRKLDEERDLEAQDKNEEENHRHVSIASTIALSPEENIQGILQIEEFEPIVSEPLSNPFSQKEHSQLTPEEFCSPLPPSKRRKMSQQNLAFFNDDGENAFGNEFANAAKVKDQFKTWIDSSENGEIELCRALNKASKEKGIEFTRKDLTYAFMQALILKTKDHIEVEQKKPYGRITIRKGPLYHEPFVCTQASPEQNVPS